VAKVLEDVAIVAAEAGPREEVRRVFFVPDDHASPPARRVAPLVVYGPRSTAVNAKSGLDAQAAHEPVERRAVDAERLRGRGPPAARGCERGTAARRRGAVEALLQRPAPGARTRAALFEEEVLGRHARVARQHDRALDRVLELADVPRPRMRAECRL